eukprot:11211204-Lingulodinium_polyedra.AAC.1
MSPLPSQPFLRCGSSKVTKGCPSSVLPLEKGGGGMAVDSEEQPRSVSLCRLSALPRIQRGRLPGGRVKD